MAGDIQRFGGRLSKIRRFGGNDDSSSLLRLRLASLCLILNFDHDHDAHTKSLLLPHCVRTFLHHGQQQLQQLPNDACRAAGYMQPRPSWHVSIQPYLPGRATSRSHTLRHCRWHRVIIIIITNVLRFTIWIARSDQTHGSNHLRLSTRICPINGQYQK